MTFQEFWQLYPRKTGKLAAAREWTRLKPDADTCIQIAATLAWQIPTWHDPQFIPHPRTWLHQGRWMDEPPVVKHPAIWTCPHLEHCGHQAMCQVKLMNPAKYPLKASVT